MASTETEAASPPASVLFKKKKRSAAAATAAAGAAPTAPPPPTSAAARHGDGDDDQKEEEKGQPRSSPVVRLRKGGPSRSARSGPLSASTGLARRLRDQQDDDEEGGEGGGEWVDRFGETIHETGTAGSAGAKRKRGVDGLLEGLDEDAQRTDAAVPVSSSAAAKATDSAAADKSYRGSAAYASYLPVRDAGQSSKLTAAAAKGPIQASKHIRTVTTVDYQPDICKDYKETGYCGFGDTCKFLHDRSDYLAGWQLDALVNSHARRGDDDDNVDDKDGEEDEEEIPFACLICRKPFTDPVVTRCGHYFCSACAVRRFRERTSKCFACGAQTGGLFNSAANVLRRMHALKRRREDDRLRKRTRWLPAGELTQDHDGSGDSDSGAENDLGIQGVTVITGDGQDAR